ncbi:hypothetical protein [Bacteriovorax sp. Seq25_V]|uniref:hypothetical protein n=1 Tax=Bacteriovorax sp. Seq25_V TaxID=1201288 RepID=UPI00054E4C28|nr:hypothetical protein [Bacteriovorax sp. Seq25_V]
MQVRIKTYSDQIVIFREKWGVILYQLFLGLAFLIMGLIFIYVGHEKVNEQVSVYFGTFFSLAGLIVIVGLFPRTRKLIHSKTGDNILTASDTFIELSAGLVAESTTYQ